MNLILLLIICIALMNGKFINGECISVSSRDCGPEEFQIHYTEPSENNDLALCGKSDELCLEYAEKSRNLHVRHFRDSYERTQFNAPGERASNHSFCPVHDMKDFKPIGWSTIGSQSLSPWRWIVNEDSNRHGEDRYILETECLCNFCLNVDGEGVSEVMKSQAVEIERYVIVNVEGSAEPQLQKQKFTYGCTCVFSEQDNS